MTIAQSIIDIAQHQNGHFTRKDLLKALCSDKKMMSEGSLSVLLSRMLNNGHIIRVSNGIYRLNTSKKSDFIYKPDQPIILLNEKIREHFPFVDYCIWNPSALVHLMQHIPSVKLTLIDVEREAMEAVFSFLQGENIRTRIILAPTEQECERYISNDDLIIVRPLVKESPLAVVDGCNVPTIEKMLVDAIQDKELKYLQGNELYTIYSNAYAVYNINESKLLRYASRRNRKDKVTEIINTVNTK